MGEESTQKKMMGQKYTEYGKTINQWQLIKLWRKWSSSNSRFSDVVYFKIVLFYVCVFEGKYIYFKNWESKFNG